MKVYLFDNETGCYQGEDFADEPLDTSVTADLSDATMIAPPPFGPGEIPVFHRRGATWQISRIEDLKRLLALRHRAA